MKRLILDMLIESELFSYRKEVLFLLVYRFLIESNGKTHPPGVFAGKPSSSKPPMLPHAPLFASGEAWSGAEGVRRVPPKSLTAATSSQPE